MSVGGNMGGKVHQAGILYLKLSPGIISRDVAAIVWLAHLKLNIYYNEHIH